MRKTVVKRLIGGSLLFLIAIALLSLCVGALVLFDRAASEDSELLHSLAAALQQVGGRAGLAFAGAAEPPAVSALLGALDEATGGLDASLASAAASAADSPRASPVREMLSTPASRKAMEDAVAFLQTDWRDALQAFTIAVRDRAAVEAGGSAGRAYSALTEKTFQALARVREARAGIASSRRASLRVVLLLFAVFAVFGAASALAYSLYALLTLRRDLASLLASGRRI
ncbi:MAG: hypothetical protein IMZ55_15010, partial [Acidobacteria bacterium]|nr:hypothetical protein [Acidobacteriota bacterium]